MKKKLTIFIIIISVFVILNHFDNIQIGDQVLKHLFTNAVNANEESQNENLMISRFNTIDGKRDTTSERYFWEYRQNIKNITFNNKIEDKDDEISTTCGSNKDELCKWDVSNKNDDSIIAYLTDNEDNTYDLYIMANGNIYAPVDSYALFGAVRAANGGFENLESFNNIKYLKTDYVTDMSNFFKEMHTLKTIDLSGFNTSRTKVFNSMFEDCFELEELDLTSFNTSSATSMNSMFNKMMKMNKFDLSSFDTSNVTDMSYMFKENSVLTQIDISNFDTRSLTMMKEMFSTMNNLKTIYVSEKFVTTKVSTTGASNIFKSSPKIVGGNGTTWNQANISKKQYAAIDSAIYDENKTLISGTPGYFTKVEVEKINVKQKPTKLEYFENEELNTEGLVIETIYNNGKKEEIDDYTININTPLTTNDTIVVIKYNEFETSFDIIVNKILLTDIEIENQPTKKIYFVGQKFDKTGMKVNALYNNETKKEITDYEILPEILQEDTTSVTVKYKEYSKTIDITVKEAKVTSIEILTPPTKTDYFEGDYFDKTGMIINAILENGEKKEIDDYEIENSELTLNDTKVTIIYEDYKVTQDITVKELKVTGIEIAKNPDKLSYIEGEKFNKEGLVVNKILNNGKKIEIDDYEIDLEELTLENQKVTISYQEYKKYIDITVTKTKIESIVIEQNPTKTEYFEGEKFDPTGMIVKVKYDNGKEEQVDEITYYTGKLTDDNSIFTISYGDYNAELNLTINKVLPEYISVEQIPTKTEYFEGEKFDPTGMVLKLYYNNGESKEITDYDYEKQNLTIIDDIIIVSYNNFIATVNITVKKIEIIEIKVINQPIKTEYLEGESFDKKGLIVEATYNNGKKEIITNYIINHNESLTADIKTIEITYNSFSTNININVKEKYKFTEGIDEIYTNDSMTFRVSGPLEQFIKLLINGKEIDKDNYTLKEGSTIITLKDEYLKTLDNGTYKMQAVYSDGQIVDNTFIINRKQDEKNNDIQIIENPKTNANKPWLYIIIISIIFFTSSFIYKRNSN